MQYLEGQDVAVTPCERRVSRNASGTVVPPRAGVTPCERRVSRNDVDDLKKRGMMSRLARGV